MANLNRSISAVYPEYLDLQPVRENYQTHPIEKKGLVQQKKHLNVRYWFYILINAALLFGVIQCLRVLITDSLRLAALAHSQVAVQHLYTQSRLDHEILQNKIKIYSSRSGIEELARNYLNMVGKDELPVHFQSKLH